MPERFFFECRTFAFEARHFLLGKQFVPAIGCHQIQLLEPFDGLLDCREVSQQATQPPLVDEVHSTALSFFLNCVLRLSFGSDEQNVFALVCQLGDELSSFFKKPQCLLEIDDVDPVAFAEDILLHLRVPTFRLMSEMYTSLQKLLHCDRRQINLLCKFSDKCE